MNQRVFGFVLILGLLGLSGYAALEHARKGTLSPAKQISAAEARAELASAQYVLGIVAGELERIKVVSGTYDNQLDLREFPLVSLKRADERSYCLEFEKTQTFALAGPGGATALGSCD